MQPTRELELGVEPEVESGLHEPGLEPGFEPGFKLLMVSL